MIHKKQSVPAHKQGTLAYETGKLHQCNCSINCENPAIQGEAFCRLHLRNCPRISPLTGVEPDYHPELWNKTKAFMKTHNCYSYAMNVRDPKQIEKCKGKKRCSAPYHQPGEASGYEPFTNNLPKTCPNMAMRIFGDNHDVLRAEFTDKCPVNYSKIALIVDQSDDYHFLRQDSDRYWSHKPGGNLATNLDAYDHKIWDPKLANYNYKSLKNGSSLNYDIFCSYFCVPRNRPLYMKARGGGAANLVTHRGGTANPVTERFKASRSARARPVSALTRPFRTEKTRRAKKD